MKIVPDGATIHAEAHHGTTECVVCDEPIGGAPHAHLARIRPNRVAVYVVHASGDCLADPLVCALEGEGYSWVQIVPAAECRLAEGHG